MLDNTSLSFPQFNSLIVSQSLPSPPTALITGSSWKPSGCSSSTLWISLAVELTWFSSVSNRHRSAPSIYNCLVRWRRCCTNRRHLFIHQRARLPQPPRPTPQCTHQLPINSPSRCSDTPMHRNQPLDGRRSAESKRRVDSRSVEFIVMSRPDIAFIIANKRAPMAITRQRFLLQTPCIVKLL